jgi:HrpA-like RNA helicase
LIEDENFVHQSAKLQISSDSRRLFQQHLSQFPKAAPQSGNITRKVELINNFQPFALTSSPSVPNKVVQSNNVIINIRKNLSIHGYKDKIMQAIDENRILLVQGSTGSGKTTQIPQFIMETASERETPCRIICTQPRRISAIASAERVCYESGVSLGTAVGYQIRLDSKISAGSNCIFLTPGVFLRYMMGRNPEKLFKNITHIIIDEAHERNKENDFLLTSIKEHFEVNQNLRLIIMSATMDTAIFKNYFGTNAEISIAIKQYNVEEIYLEDVLKMVNFSNRKVEELNARYRSGQLIQATQSAYINEELNEAGSSGVEDDEKFKDYLDELLENMSTHDDPEGFFDEFLCYVINDGTPVNYRHRQTRMTALMIAIGREWNDMVEKLLQLKADPNLMVDFGGYEMNSFEIADKLHGSDSRTKELLMASTTSQKQNLTNDDCYNKALLNIYQDSLLKTKTNQFVVEESIDHELIVQLVEKIHNETDRNGAILIFLPGFDDIIQLSRLIEERIKYDTTMFLLHSSMRTADQKNVFKPTAHGKRKIILSTNIAESSITIDDVVYVIDSGREKQKSYDAISHASSLRVQWISKASANQRRGRAGRLRDGIVYRIYSRDRFSSMLEVTIPELLRTSLTEICLQTKLLIDEKSKIEDFLRRCIACPSLANIRQSIKYLQKMGALDSEENLTLLGSHLVGMPLEAKYGKMLIYSVILKCLGPILSLVSILTMGDQVFNLPVNPSDRFRCEQWRKSVAGEAYSDHFLMLKIFNHWMNLKQNNQSDKKFCEENFISSYHIEHVRGIRNQIMSYMQSSGLVKENSSELNKNSDKWPVIKAVIAAGLYPFVARIERRKGSMYTEIDHRLSFHMGSVMCVKKEGYKQTIRKLPVDWAVFEEKNRIGRVPMLKCNTLLGSVAMCFAAGFELKTDTTEVLPDDGDEDYEDIDEEDDYDEEDEEEDGDEFLSIKVDNFIKFFSTKDDSAMLLALRDQLNDMLQRYLSEKQFSHRRDENSLVDVICHATIAEDNASGLKTMHTGGPIQVPNASAQMNNNNFRNNQSGGRGGGGGRQNDPHSNFRGGGGGQRNEIQRNLNWRNAEQNPPSTSNPFRDSSQRGPRANTSRNVQNYTPSDFSSYGKRSRPSQNQGQSNFSYGNQRFYIMKMNNHRIFGNILQRTVVSLEELNLQVWQFHKIRGQLKKDCHVHIIFFSSTTKCFLGYGDVSKIDDSNPLQFYLRYSKNLPLAQLGCTKFAQDIAHPLTHPSFQFHELDQTSGNSLIIYFQS